jgi:hypothetical protein
MDSSSMQFPKSFLDGTMATRDDRLERHLAEQSIAVNVNQCKIIEKSNNQ